MGLFNRGRICELWQYDAKAPLVSSAVVVPLGSRHVILIGTKSGTLLCVDDAGKELWRFGASEKLGAVDEYFVDTERVHSVDAAPVVADINMDGKPEVLFGTELGLLFCLDMAGKLLWKHDCKGSIRASVCVADMNSDGHPEILVGAGSKLLAFDGKGQKLFEHTSEAAVESTPGVLKAKQALIIFGNSNGTLTAITPGQQMIWKVELEHKIVAAPAFFEEQQYHIVIGTLGGDVLCISEQGEILWSFKTEGSIYSAATITDINEDKSPEIIVASCDNSIYALTTSGQRLWSYATDFWITASPVVADFDGDGKLEVVAGSYDHNLYVLDSRGAYVLDYVPGLSGIVNQAGHYSNLLTSDPGEQTGKKLFQYRTAGIIVGCTLVPSQKPRIVVSTKTGQLVSLYHEAS